uniref:V3 Protein n=1 Tax=Prunus geminivirus A TaxID=2022321 RepID=A0A2L1GUS3_9GEMI|nr:V3 Protein [Prunus geminivirus A]
MMFLVVVGMMLSVIAYIWRVLLLPDILSGYILMGLLISIMVLFFHRPRCLIWRVYDQVSEVGLYDGYDDVVKDIPIDWDDDESYMVSDEYAEFLETLKRRRSERGGMTSNLKRRRVMVDPDEDVVKRLKEYLGEDEYDRHRRRLDLELGSGQHRPDSRCVVM